MRRSEQVMKGHKAAVKERPSDRLVQHKDNRQPKDQTVKAHSGVVDMKRRKVKRWLNNIPTNLHSGKLSSIIASLCKF